MIIPPDLEKYISDARSSGISDLDIRKELLNVGWDSTIVNNVLPVRDQISNFKGGKKILLISSFVTVLIALFVVLFFGLKNFEAKKSSVDTQSTKIKVIYAELDYFLKNLTPSQSRLVLFKPIDRELKKVDTSQYPYTTVLSYRFKTPWGQGETSEKTKTNDNLKQIIFSNGKKLILSCATSTPRQELFSMLNESDSQDYKTSLNQIVEYLGDRADSGYKYTDFILSATPSDVLVAKSEVEAESLTKVIIWKTVTSPSDRQPYRFSSPKIKGFQFGDYSGGEDISVLIFPENGAMCNLIAGKASDISQEDVDVILSTFESI